MNKINKSVRFNIGKFECLVLRDTISPMELGFLFSNTPAAQLEQVLKQYKIQPGKVMDIMNLFVKTPDHCILVDTGWGATSQPEPGKLLENLRLQKIEPEEIDTVIISHAHPDHIGGITDESGRLVFPNARYFMCKKGWEFWTSEPDMTQTDKNMAHTIMTTIQKNLVPIENRLSLVDNDAEILPGIEFIKTPGHSPDHSVLVISSGKEQLLYSADVFHHPLQIARPDIGTAIDLAPEQALKFRINIINRIAANNMMVFACHFPFPGIGHLIKKDNAFLWQPVKMPV